jgi:hypothetical protein
MPNVGHVLMTRFNIRYGTFANTRALSPEWLAGRMELFRKFTVPSVATQSRLPDAWLVFFDEETPEATRDQFRQLAAQLPLLRAEYCGNLVSEEFASQLWVERVRGVMAPATEWLITTRLDNDDALHRRFIETVQSLARPGVREFLNPTCGLILENGKLYRDRHDSNPFITLSEPAADCRTVFIDGHTRVASHWPVRQFALPDAWIQVVHGGNLVNRVRGVLISPTKVSPDALPPTPGATLATVRLGERLFYNCFWRYAVRAWRRGRRMLASRRSV